MNYSNQVRAGPSGLADRGGERAPAEPWAASRSGTVSLPYQVECPGANCWTSTRRLIKKGRLVRFCPWCTSPNNDQKPLYKTKNQLHRHPWEPCRCWLWRSRRRHGPGFSFEVGARAPSNIRHWHWHCTGTAQALHRKPRFGVVLEQGGFETAS